MPKEDVMTMTTLDEIAARAELATEGPWIVRRDHFDAGPGPDDEAQDWYIVEGADAVEHWAHYHEATTEFIAHAREDVPRLVAALKAVEAVAAQAKRGHLGIAETHSKSHTAAVIGRAIDAAIREALGS